MPFKKQITTTLKCINATTDCYHWRFNQAWTSTWPCAKLSLYTTHSKTDVIPDIARKGSIEIVSYSMDVCFDDDYVGAVNHITHKKNVLLLTTNCGLWFYGRASVAADIGRAHFQLLALISLSMASKILG